MVSSTLTARSAHPCSPAVGVLRRFVGGASASGGGYGRAERPK